MVRASLCHGEDVSSFDQGQPLFAFAVFAVPLPSQAPLTALAS